MNEYAEPSTLTSTVFDTSSTFIEKEDITVIVPTLNEEKAIAYVIKSLKIEGYNNILVVDGHSSDDTINIVKNLNVKLVTQNGLGKTGGVKTALEFVNTPYIAIIDGDFTYSPQDLNMLLEICHNYNQVIGSRQDRSNIKLLNRFGNTIINSMFNLIFGTNLTDVCSGLYVLKTQFAKKLVFNTEGFDVEVEIAAQAAESNSIREVPISYGKRIGVQKLNPIRDGYRIITRMVKLGLKYNPLITYSLLLGFSLLFFGITLVYLEYSSILNSRLFLLLASISSMISLIGVQFIILSVVLSRLKSFTKSRKTHV